MQNRNNKQQTRTKKHKHTHIIYRPYNFSIYTEKATPLIVIKPRKPEVMVILYMLPGPGRDERNPNSYNISTDIHF